MKVTETADGVVIAVKVQPGAKRSAITGVHADALKIAVAAPPVDGKANAELIKFLSEALGVKRGQIQIIRGEKAKQKQVLLTGLTANDVSKLAPQFTS